MKKLTLKLDELAVDSFQPAAEEKDTDGSVEAYATLVVGTCFSCADTCRSCLGTCPRPCEV